MSEQRVHARVATVQRCTAPLARSSSSSISIMSTAGCGTHNVSCYGARYKYVDHFGYQQSVTVPLPLLQQRTAANGVAHEVCARCVYA